VYALSRPHVVRRAPILEGTPLPLLATLGVVAATAWGLAAAGLLPAGHARAVGAGAAQGALLATAAGWMVPRQDPSRGFVPVGVAAVAMLGAVGAAAAPWGAVGYLLAPLWLWRRRARLRQLGLDTPDARLALAGAVLGAILGLHLGITASLTLGYRIGRPAPFEHGPWLAYDLGANVLAAECFFRGALFDRAQRRWSFGAAAVISTTACVIRYLLDPLLPRTLEVVAGAAFYVGLLSVANCWLYWRSGSVVPGFAAGVVFFTVYRLLHVVR
jgi:membrane protease YdiL (CAAX protease family)